MARPHLLLVDADPRTVRVLEVNLKNDGFSVTAATDGAEALSKLEFTLPDVLVAETRLPRVDGFELVRRLRALPGGERVAVVLVAPEPVARGPNGLSAAAVDQLRAVEIGVPDCLTKPVSVRELVTRVNLMLARRTQAMLTSGSGEQTQFSGHLQDMGVIDLLQAVEAGRRSGILQIEHGTRAATVLFKNGKVVDAEQGQLRGEEALYRTFLWTTGVFDVEFVEVTAVDNIPIGTAALLMEGMRRIDEWGRLAEQLPSAASVFAVDADVLLERLAEVPDELNPVLRLFDGERSLMTVIDESPFDDLSTLSVVSKLYFEGVLRVVDAAPASRLASARALGVGGVHADGNVVRLPHVPEVNEVVIQARPHAPEMTPDPVPRSLVYSEPPQNLRMSQRAPSPSRVAGATLIGLPPILPSGGSDKAARAYSRESASEVGANPRDARGESTNAQPSVVSEAEFEDVLPDNHRPVAASSADATVEGHRGLSSGAVVQAPPAVTPPKSAVDRGHEPTASPAAKATKEPLEHDFFAVGDEGTYDGGPLSDEPPEVTQRPSSSEEIELDPRVLAALQARRDQGRRWVTWVFGISLLLLLWGLVTVLGGPSEEAEPVANRSTTLPSSPAPTAETSPAAAPPEVIAEVPTSDVFEEVPQTSGATPANWGAPASAKSGGELSTPSLGLPRSTGAGPRGKKPPTARFPSTPDQQ